MMRVGVFNRCWCMSRWVLIALSLYVYSLCFFLRKTNLRIILLLALGI